MIILFTGSKDIQIAVSYFIDRKNLNIYKIGTTKITLFT